jgi:hypothetical protein
MKLRRSVVVLSMCVTALALLPLGAQGRARKTQFDTPVQGTTSHGTFKGRLTVQGFRLKGSQVVATGELVGTLRDSRFPSAQHIDQSSTRLPVIADGGGSCSKLVLVYPETDIPVQDIRTHTRRQTVTVRASGANRKIEANVICGIQGLVAAAPSANAPLVHLLNALFELQR